MELDIHAQTEDNTPDNTTTANTNTIATSVLIELYNARFRKPLLPDSKRANVYDHLITEEEIIAYPSAEGKPVRIIHQNPNFWTETRLKEKPYLFHNVATTFGLTDMKDSKGMSSCAFLENVICRLRRRFIFSIQHYFMNTRFFLKNMLNVLHTSQC
ncbi:MAG: hypothetical protein WAM14_11160 [Candidatus Nitrosopolaris sp.]